MSTRSHRPVVPVLAVLALLAAAVPADANPVFIRDQPGSGVVFDAEVAMLVVVGIAAEWAIVRAFLRGSIRSERHLAVLIVLANVLSYPIALVTADLLVSRGRGPALVTAELAAVGLEYFVYVVVLHGFESTSPLRPGTSGLRLLAATVTANVATALLGVAYIGVRAGGTP